MLGKAYVDAISLPLRTARFLGSALPSLRRVRRGLRNHEFEKAPEPPRTRFQGSVSGERMVNATRFDFAAVRGIKNAVPGATINDVMLAVVGGALRHYLQHHGELPEQSLSAGCPIDVREESEKSSGGNMIGLMTVALGSDIADPVERLRAISGYSHDAKAYAQALGPRLGVDITDLVPGAVMAVALRTAAATGLMESSIMCNTVVTNVPGPPFQLYFCGAELIDGFSTGPLMPNVGLFHVVYSSVQNKQGTLTLSITSCPKMMPDSDFYLNCLRSSFDELYEKSVGGAAPKESKKAGNKAGSKAASKPRSGASRRRGAPA
jgi:WS/DGAT/MGAT family acyltransferase